MKILFKIFNYYFLFISDSLADEIKVFEFTENELSNLR